MEIKIKRLSIELNNKKAFELEEELNSLIFGITVDDVKQRKLYPLLDELRECLLKNKNKLK